MAVVLLALRVSGIAISSGAVGVIGSDRRAVRSEKTKLPLSFHEMSPQRAKSVLF